MKTAAKQAQLERERREHMELPVESERGAKANEVPGTGQGELGLVAGVVAGAATGAVAGAIAGPPGAIIGAAIGAAIGGGAEQALESQGDEDARVESALDDAIGVTDGDLGAASRRQPPGRIGAFSSASAGAGAITDDAPSAGPMPIGSQKS